MSFMIETLKLFLTLAISVFFLLSRVEHDKFHNLGAWIIMSIGLSIHLFDDCIRNNVVLSQSLAYIQNHIATNLFYCW